MTKRRIPLKFICAVLFVLTETVAALCFCYYLAERLPYFKAVIFLTEAVCVVRIINSEDNPEYKVPWLLVVLVLPAGFLPYLVFYSRRLSKGETEKLFSISGRVPKRSRNEPPTDTARLICECAGASGYRNTAAEYISSGKETMQRLLCDLKSATSFIFLEYFIIEDGEFWSRVEEIIREKSLHGVEVRLIYDDVGCMCRLSGEAVRRLKSSGIKAISHNPVKANADCGANNRTHRKIAVIDGRVGYIGGVNLTDECIGYWKKGDFKDCAVRIAGDATNELSYLFLCDCALSSTGADENFEKYYRYGRKDKSYGFILPFGDGPRPIYKRRVSKTAIISLLAEAKKYIYITTPYLVIESEICSAIESAALRGVDVRIIIPRVPDKKLVFLLTKSSCRRLTEGGVRIFEYTPGFIHSKTYLADGESAIVGSMNLDYRSLAHNFENGIYFHRHVAVKEIEKDFIKTLRQSAQIKREPSKNPLSRLIGSLIKVFSPLF